MKPETSQERAVHGNCRAEGQLPSETRLGMDEYRRVIGMVTGTIGAISSDYKTARIDPGAKIGN